MKTFKQNELTYTQTQKINGGIQFRCDYPDGQWAVAMVYKLRPTRKDVIDAINEANEANEI